MLVIKTEDPLPLRVDNATAQKLGVMKSGGTIGWFSVTELRVGDYLFHATDRRWVRVIEISNAPSGTHKMYDIYDTTPGNYIADGYLDPQKQLPTGGLASTPTATQPGAVSSTYAINYTYNGELLDRIGYPAGFTVKYSYDGLGRVVNVTQPVTSPVLYASFTYYRNDRVKTTTYGNGLVTSYTYDGLGRPSQVVVKNRGNIVLSLALPTTRPGQWRASSP